MTQGEAMALCHALALYSGAAAHEVLLSLRRAVQAAGNTDEGQALYTATRA